jgi:hypothetical protein
MENGMTDEEKKKIITDATEEIDGKQKLACPKAFQLSKEQGIALKEIGQICDDNNIRINKCQLGCFK